MKGAVMEDQNQVFGVRKCTIVGCGKLLLTNNDYFKHGFDHTETVEMTYGEYKKLLRERREKK